MLKLSRCLFIICTLLVFLCVPQFIRGFYFNLIYLSTNKTNYYIYENIVINAEWELYYDFEGEVSFVQIQVYDFSDELIWYSFEYSNMGFNSESWIVYIPNLHLSFPNESTQLYVKFYHFLDDGEKMISTFREIINLTILKADLSCELFGYRNSLTYGETINFSVKFFERTNNSVLVNQTIFFKIESNDKLAFARDFITNDLGKIYLNLSTLDELNLGKNVLKFIINDSIIYDPTQFIYDIYVNKVPISVNTTRCERDAFISEQINIDLQYYYIFNGEPIALSNRTIFVKISQKSSLKKIFFSNTNLNGSLFTEISYSTLGLDKKISELKIQFIFDGSEYLENKTTNIMIEINILSHSSHLDAIQMISMSGLITSVIIFGGFIINKKQKKEKRVADLQIRI